MPIRKAQARRLALAIWAMTIGVAALLSAAGAGLEQLGFDFTHSRVAGRDARIRMAATLSTRVQRPMETMRRAAGSLDGSTDPAARDAESVTDEAWAPLEERSPEDLVGQAFSAATAADRAAAVDALAYALPSDSGKEDYVAWVLTQALTDPDSRVRGQALATLKDTAEYPPLAAVAQVVRDDPDPALRIQALELLVERTGEQAREPLRLALADPDPVVRVRADELIADWHLSLDGE